MLDSLQHFQTQEKRNIPRISVPLSHTKLRGSPFQSPPGHRSSPFRRSDRPATKLRSEQRTRGLEPPLPPLPNTPGAQSPHPAGEAATDSNPAPGPSSLRPGPLGAQTARARPVPAGLTPRSSPAHAPEGSPRPRTAPTDAAPEEPGAGPPGASTRALTHAPARLCSQPAAPIPPVGP